MAKNRSVASYFLLHPHPHCHAMAVAVTFLYVSIVYNNKGGTISCFAIKKLKGENMNKEALALALCFVGYLSGCYVSDSMAITATAMMEHLGCCVCFWLSLSIHSLMTRSH